MCCRCNGQLLVAASHFYRCPVVRAGQLVRGYEDQRKELGELRTEPEYG